MNRKLLYDLLSVRSPGPLRNSQTTRNISGRDRVYRHSSHLGPEPHGSSPYPLYCHRRWTLPDRSRWVSSRKGFFIPVRVISALFKGKFLDLLKKCFKLDALVFPGSISHLKEPGAFESFRRHLYHKKWVVYCRPPFDGVQGVLQYLGRYTHRIAISNNRILTNQDGNVSFRWRDYADDNRLKTMTLKADEFIRRFLLHVLPSRYVRIRHFGLLANRNRKNTIPLCREILSSGKTVIKETARQQTWQEQLLRICGTDVTVVRLSERKDVHDSAVTPLSVQ